MKRVIRLNCFETNSSSQHSIIVTKNDVRVNPEELDWNKVKDENEPYSYERIYLYKGKWNLRDIDDGFGRYPFQLLTTFEEKFKYAMCEYLGHLYEDDPEWQEQYDMFKAIASEVIPGFEDFNIRTKDIDIYLDKDGNDIKQKDLHYNYWNKEEKHPEYYYIDKDGNKQQAIFDEENYLEMPNIGTIDHQSAGLLKNFLKDKNIDLKEFLTNKRYVVVIDGDERDDFQRYYDSGLINKDYITEIYDKSGEDIEFKEWLEREKNYEENDTE